MIDQQTRTYLEAAVRGIATAGKTLRLYPPTSPIPRQAIDTAGAAIADFFTLNPVLSLEVGRDSFTWQGEPIASGVPGISDLADMLREHGVAELSVLPGCSADELIGFLGLAMRPVTELAEQGGLAAATASAGIECVRTTEVRLTVLEEVAPAADQDIDEFLRQLANDPDRLAAWMAAASAGDPSAFAEGLEGLANAAGPSGLARLTETMAQAFLRQESSGRDAIMGLALDSGPVRSLAERMFSHIGTADIASSMCGGLYGKNMLSLSSALTSLPLQERMEAVRRDVQRMLAEGPHTEKEATFFEHMMEVRTRTEPETSLVQREPTYLKVAEIATVSTDELERMRHETERSQESVHAAGVSTMLTLLDQQTDFDLYCRSIDSLASTVPRLIEHGEFELAQRVVGELAARESRAHQPWPELTDRLREAIAHAVDRRSMSALLRAVIDDPASVEHARRIVQVAGDAGAPTLAAEAIALKHEGIAAAESIIGRRILDLLIAALPSTQWFQVSAVVERLSSENDPRSAGAIESVLSRNDEQSRREAANGLAGSHGPVAERLLGALVRDASPEVAIVAIRAIAKHDTPGAARILGAALSEMDTDNKDFPLAREIVGALARVKDNEADRVLSQLASRKMLIKRGRFAEFQDLVRQAQAVRSGKGGAQ